jgi:hypothetical protein
MLIVTNAECHIYTLYAECRYAECRYAECRGAMELVQLGLIFKIFKHKVKNFDNDQNQILTKGSHDKTFNVSVLPCPGANVMKLFTSVIY